MSSDVEQFLHYRIANAPVRRYPYPHFYIEEIFPADWYKELLSHLPHTRHYRRLNETGAVTEGAYPERYVCELPAAFLAERPADRDASPWAILSRVFSGPDFAQRVLALFASDAMARFGSDAELDYQVQCQLVRDFSNYSIAPHTDTPRKLVSLLFYLPPDLSMRSLGTSIYVPNDPAFRCEGTVHHSFADFKRVTTMPYLPNSLFGFFKTDNSFHGVERIEKKRTQRDSILYNVYVKKLGKRAAAA
jgi:hypothetical protein